MTAEQIWARLVISGVVIFTVALIGGHAAGYMQGYRAANARVLALPQNGCP